MCRRSDGRTKAAVVTSPGVLRSSPRNEDLRPRPSVRGWILVTTIVSLSAAAGLALGWFGVGAGIAALVLAPLLLLFMLGAARRPILLAAVVPVSQPIGEVLIPGGILQGAHLAMALTVGLVVIHRQLIGLPLRPAMPGAFGLLLFDTCVLLSLPQALDLATAIRQTVVVVLASLFVLAFVAAIQTFAQFRVISALTLAGAGVVCATAFGDVSSVKGTAGGVIVEGATGLFSEHNQMGSFAAAAAMLSIGVVLAAQSRMGRLAAAVVTVISLGAVALALSRGAYIGTALGLLYLLIILPAARNAFRRALIPLLGVGVGLAVLAPYVSQITLVLRRVGSLARPSSNPYDARPQIWAEAGRQIRAHPWVGVGPGNFPVVSHQVGSEAAYADAAHAHNVILTVAAEVGIPAALVFIGLTLYWSTVSAKSIRRLSPGPAAALVAGPAAALVSFVGQGILDVTLRSPLILLLFCLCLALSLTLESGEAGAPRSVDAALSSSSGAPRGPYPIQQLGSMKSATESSTGLGLRSRVKRPKLS